MKKPGKIAAIVVAILVVLVVAVVVLAKLLVTPERIRATVLPLAQEKLHRKVELGDIEVSLFSGVVLRNLVVREREGDETFVAADRVRLSYQFWPLFFMRVVIDEIALDAPRIRIVRQADGSFNFSDLTAQGEQKEPAAPAAEPQEGEPVDLLVSEVVLSDGEIIFLDHALASDTPYRFRLSDLFVNARDISLSDPFPFRLQARFNQATLDVEGEADPARQTGKANVLLSDLDVTAFSPYFQEQLPGKLGSLSLDLDLAAEGGAQVVESSGKVSLKGLDLTLDAMPDTPVRNTDLTLDYTVKADLDASVIELGETTAAVNGIPLHLSGRVEDFTGEAVVDLVARLENLDLKAVADAVPDAFAAPVTELDPAGSLDARVHLAGSAAEPLKLLREGRVDLQAVEVSAGGVRPSLTGMLNLTGDALSAERLLLQIGENVATIKLQARNLFAEPIIVRSEVMAEEFLLDPLLKATAAPAAGEDTAQREPEGAGEKAPTEELGPFDIPVSAEGSVLVGKGIYQGLSIDDFELRYRLENNVLEIQKLAGRIAGGSFNQTGTVDLSRKGLAYDIRLETKGIQADPLLSAFFPRAGGTVFGNLDLATQVSGQGTLAETIKRNLSGKGSLLLADGKITGAGLVQGLAEFLDLEELRVMQFSRTQGSFTINNGRVNINSDMSGKDVRMSPTGTVGLDGSLDVALDLALSPDLTAKIDGGGKAAQFFTGAEGWGELPLKVAGSIGSPRFVLDTSAARERVKEKAQEEIQKKLQEKVFDKLAPKEGEDDSLAPAKKKLEESIRGLFGN